MKEDFILIIVVLILGFILYEILKPKRIERRIERIEIPIRKLPPVVRLPIYPSPLDLQLT